MSPRRPLLALAVGIGVLGLLAGGARLLGGSGSEPRRLSTTDRPTDRATPQAIVSVSYDDALVGPGRRERPFRLTLAVDGSFRWSALDGVQDVAYDASLGQAVEVFQGDSDAESDAGGADGSRNDAAAFVATGVPPGGPDRRVPVPPPLGSLADHVTALGRSGDARVSRSTFLDRPTWHYSGPVKADRRRTRSPDRAVIHVDQESGVLLLLDLSAQGESFQRLTAATVEEGETTDRSRFRRQPRPGTDAAAIPHGFLPRSLEEADGDVGYQLLVPSQVPEGFRLASVTVNAALPSATGAPGAKNPPSTEVATLQWRRGFLSFTVTLRPQRGATWNDPFGGGGFDFEAQPVRLALPGRHPLVGELVLDAPARPHLWGITGDVVVTVDGDLGAAELRRVAGSLRPLQA